MHDNINKLKLTLTTNVNDIIYMYINYIAIGLYIYGRDMEPTLANVDVYCTAHVVGLCDGAG